MKKAFRWIFYILLSIGLVVTIGVIVANSLIKSKLERFIAEELPKNMEGSYKDLSIHLLNGSLLLTNPSLTVRNKEDSIKHTFINVKELRISGISYWRYLIKNEIHIGEITLENPEVTYYKDRKNPIKDTVPQDAAKINKPIFVDLLQIDSAELTIYETGKDSIKLNTRDLSVKIEGIELNNETISQKMPIKYETIEANGGTIFVKANDYDNLNVESFSLENRDAVFKNLNFQTKYSKTELSRIIKVERDHYDLSLKSLSVNQLNFGFIKEEFFAKSRKVVLNTPSLIIFRDKLVQDDPNIKPLYSQSLRELPFQLTVDSVSIDNGFLEYEERVKEENRGGSINFKKLNATFSNVSNTYKSPEKTELKIDALFMDKTPLTVQWSFDVQNSNDEFLFKAEIGAMDAKKMNSFTEPNLKVRLEGQVDRTYFTIDGNNSTSQTDMKINYSDFKISVLQKDSGKKDKFLSAIVNIFISKDSEKKNDQYREASADATRDKTKSIFNFLWISVKNALQKCVTGSTK